MSWFLPLAALVAATASFIELIQRYSVGTSLGYFLKTGTVWAYLVINAVVAALIFMFLSKTEADLKLGLFGAAATSEVALAFVAGLGGMAILRSGVISLKVGDHQYSVGPGIFLDILLTYIDLKIDQSRAVGSAAEVDEVMKNVASRSAVPLTTVCLHMLERVSPATQAAVAAEVRKVSESLDGEKARQFCLGISIRKVAGLEVLKTAVKILGNEIKLGTDAPNVDGSFNNGTENRQIPIETMGKLDKFYSKLTGSKVIK